VAIQYFAIVVLNKVLKNIPNKIPKTTSKTTPSYAPPLRRRGINYKGLLALSKNVWNTT
jgi:hypothetical protein